MLYNFTYIKIFFLNVGWQKNLNKYKTIFLNVMKLNVKKNMQLISHVMFMFYTS